MEYRIIVDDNSDPATRGLGEPYPNGYTARVVDWDSDDPTPLRAHGPNPIAALRELAKVLADWQEGGADRWLNTPDGTKLARQFCPEFEPGRPGGSA